MSMLSVGSLPVSGDPGYILGKHIIVVVRIILFTRKIM